MQPSAPSRGDAGAAGRLRDRCLLLLLLLLGRRGLLFLLIGLLIGHRLLLLLLRLSLGRCGLRVVVIVAAANERESGSTDNRRAPMRSTASVGTSCCGACGSNSCEQSWVFLPGGRMFAQSSGLKQEAKTRGPT